MDDLVKKFLTPQIPLTELAQKKLEKLALLDDIEGIAVFPDVHAKPDNPYPTGTAVATRNKIYPSLIGQDIGCAMSVWQTKLKAGALRQDDINVIFNNIREQVNDGKPNRQRIPRVKLNSILERGGHWCVDEGLINENVLDKVERKGQFLSAEEQDKVSQIIPKDSLKGGITKFQSLGGGNHFLELQRVCEILDPSVASTIGLKEDDVLLWIHTGSGSLGKRLENYYTNRWNTQDTKRRWRQKIRRFKYHFCMETASHMSHYVAGYDADEGIHVESFEGKKYLRAHRAAMNFALVNRVILANLTAQAVKKVTEDSQISLLIDVAHESIQKEHINGKDLWVHRNGASRAVPPQNWEDPWKQNMGQLLPLPGSLGSSSYLAISDTGASDSYWAVNHGAGRVLEKPDARKAISQDIIDRFKEEKGHRIYYVSKGEDIAEQVPNAFKDIAEVARAIEGHKLAKLVARCESIASLKA